MADGLDNLIGESTARVMVGGKEYTVSKGWLSDHAEKESYINAMKPSLSSMLSQIPSDLPPAQVESMQKILVDKASKSAFATNDEENEFNTSPHGIAWVAWRALRDGHEEFGKGGDQVYKAPNGNWYSLTPEQGVQRCLTLIERYSDDMEAFMAALAWSEERDILPN